MYASTDGPKNVDRVRFTSSGKSLSLEDVELGVNVLTDTPSCSTWSELSRNLEFLPAGADWYWVDVFLVAPFSLDPSGDDDIGVCAQMLECFQKWLGSS